MVELPLPGIEIRPLTREAERSLWVHRVIAGRLAIDHDGVMAHAWANLARKERVHPAGTAAVYLRQWRETLSSGADVVFEVLTSRSPESVELRQNTPFAGVLTNAERWAVRKQFGEHWDREHGGGLK